MNIDPKAMLGFLRERADNAYSEWKVCEAAISSIECEGEHCSDLSPEEEARLDAMLCPGGGDCD